MLESSREGIYRIVKTVASPLRFFAIAAVALTAVIVALAWKSILPPTTTERLIVVAFAALIVLIGVVTYLVIFHPKKLVFDQEAHLTVLRERLGDNELGTTYITGMLPASQPVAPDEAANGN